MAEESKVVRESAIELRVGLDKDNIPTRIRWKAEGSPDTPDFKECKAMLLSVFDPEHLETLKIDLWTQKMQINEMDRFFYQTLRAMVDTYFKATKNKELTNAMYQFTEYFGEETEVIPRRDQKS